MKIFAIKGHQAGLFSLVLCGLFATICFSSCIKEQPELSSHSEHVSLRLATTRSVESGDKTVNTVYLMAFETKSGNKRCTYRRYVDPLDVNPFTVTDIMTGTYDFAIVANPDATIKTSLDGVNNWAELEALRATRNQLAPANNQYLMFGLQNNVVVSSNGQGAGQVTYTDEANINYVEADVLGMTLYRLAAKVALTIKHASGVTVGDVRLRGLPSDVPIVPIANQQTMTGDDQDIPLTQKSLDNTNHTITYNEQVIPSYLFTPTENVAQAATIVATIGGQEMTARLKHSPSTDVDGNADAAVDYTLHRNTKYNVTANAAQYLELQINVLPWNEHALDEMTGKYMLIDKTMQEDIPVAGGTYEVNITSHDIQWSVTTTVSGVTITPVSGTKSASVSIQIPRNESVGIREIPVVFTGMNGTDIYATATWLGKQEDIHGNSIIPKEKFANADLGWPALPRDLQVAMRGDKQMPETGTPVDDPRMEWSAINTHIPGMETVYDVNSLPPPGGGENNTDAMIAAGNNRAAEYCRAMGTEWFLPSITELKVIVENENMLGPSYKLVVLPSTGDLSEYWSSTQVDFMLAWHRGKQGELTVGQKSMSNFVRCVRYIN